MNKIVVLGAAGSIGKSLVRHLASLGKPVRAVGRQAARLHAAFADLPIEPVAADVETPDGAARAVAGAETVIFTIGLPYNEFRRYPGLMQTVVNACKQAGVQRFLLITNIYAYGPPRAEWVDETHPRVPNTFKGKMRLQQEQILEKSGLTWIILHLPDFFGPDAELSYARMIFEAAINGKAADLFAPATTPHQFVYIPDVAPVVAGLLDKDVSWNEHYNFAGSGIITVEEFAKRVYQAAGQPFRSRTVPLWLVRVIGWFKPTMREFVEMFYLQQTPVNLSDEKLKRKLGSNRTTSYEEGIEATLKAMRAKPFAPLPK